MGSDILCISHLMSIAALVPENGADQEVAIASLLHDVAEDQGSEDMLPFRGCRRRSGSHVDSDPEDTIVEVGPAP